MATDLTRGRLPTLINGRRYSHELQDPTPILSDKRRPVLERLHKFHVAVVDNAPTLSEASGTSVAARSEASVATSMTERTSTFSANNGPVQQEPIKKPLDDIQRTRKALVRKLGACAADCRKRKVKCPLWHHALRDLLEIEHTEHDEEVVEWAIRYDTELQTPGLTPAVSTRVTQFASGSNVEEERNDVMAQLNGAFNLDPGTPMPYGAGITETSASLLDGSVGVSPQPLATQDIVPPDPLAPTFYSVSRHDLMLTLGSRMPAIEPAHYCCWFDDCHKLLPLPEFMVHCQFHLPFEYIDDPLRMVCPRCDTFYNYSTDECLGCSVLSGGLVEKVYGNFSDESTTGIQSEGVAVQFGSSSFTSAGTVGVGGYLYQDSNSTPWNDGYYQNNFNDGSSGCSGVGYYSFTKSVFVNVKRSFLKTAASLLRFSNAPIRGRKYTITLVIVAVVSIIFGFKKYRWLSSNLVQLMRGISVVSPSKLPLAGVVIASVAFALHRIIVHASRVNDTRSGWLSRCALSAFNVACGRRRPEWQGTNGYDLGHERS